MDFGRRWTSQICSGSELRGWLYGHGFRFLFHLRRFLGIAGNLVVTGQTEVQRAALPCRQLRLQQLDRFRNLTEVAEALGDLQDRLLIGLWGDASLPVELSHLVKCLARIEEAD